MYAQKKQSGAQSPNTAVTSEVSAPDLQDQRGNAFVQEMLHETEYTDVTASEEAVHEDAYYGGTPAEPRAASKAAIPVAHDGWAKGEDGWKEDASVRTPVSKKTHDRGGDYDGEEENAAFRGEPKNWTKHIETKDADCAKVSTKMMKEDEAKQHELSVKDGKVMQGGKALDTNDASGIGTYNKGGKGRHIYAAPEDGAMRSVDPWAAHEEHEIQAPAPQPTLQTEGYYGEEDENQAQDDSVVSYGPTTQPPAEEGLYSYDAKEEEGPSEPQKKQVELKMANHSTLVDGKKASGAGEIKADGGEHVVLSDRSGHYKPDNEMLYNTSRSLTDQGLSPEATTIEMTNKNPGAKPGLKNGDLQVGALEFQSYGGSTEAESAMRQAREDRKPTMDAIESFDRSSLKSPTETSDRSAPKLETMGESIAKGDRPTLKSRAMFHEAQASKASQK